MYEELHKFFVPVLNKRIVASNIVFSQSNCSFRFFDEKFKDFILREPLEYLLTVRTFEQILTSYCTGVGLLTVGEMLKRVSKAGVENRNFKNIEGIFHPIDNNCSATYGKFPNLPLEFKVPQVRKDCSDIFTKQFMDESTSLRTNLNFYDYLRICRAIPELSTQIVRDDTIGVVSIACAVDSYAAVLERRSFYKINKSPTNIVAHSEKFQEKIKGNYSVEEYYFTLI